MKTSIRLIGRIAYKEPNVVKGIHRAGLRIVSELGPLAGRYYETESILRNVEMASVPELTFAAV